jgi:1,4-dihydroxy-2-naphthoyl-CoA hydrolase
MPVSAADGNAAIQGYFPGDLGVELVSVDADEVRGRLAVDRRHLHPGHVVHGGVWVAFADTLAAWGTIHSLGDDAPFGTVELKANVVAAARAGDVLEGVARPLHQGARTQVWEVRIERAGRLAAFFTCTQMIDRPA